MVGYGVKDRFYWPVCPGGIFGVPPGHGLSFANKKDQIWGTQLLIDLELNWVIRLSAPLGPPPYAYMVDPCLQT